MRLTDDHRVVEAFAPHASEQSFANSICSWCIDRCSQDLAVRSNSNHLEVPTKLRIIVADERPRGLGGLLIHGLPHEQHDGPSSTADLIHTRLVVTKCWGDPQAVPSL
jgi:hypothetical protein